MTRLLRVLLASSLLGVTALDAQQSAVPSAAPAGLPSIASRTAGMVKRDGFFPLYWDDRTGKLYLEIPAMEQEFIYFTSLPWAVGSNDIGLDRNQLGRERLVAFTRSGPRVLLIEKNTNFRGVTKDSNEARGVEESFARSAVFGFNVEAQDGARVLVDATEFVVRDAHDATGALRRTQQGTYTLDRGRSAVHMPRTKAFPRNTEIEVTLTLAGSNPGRYVRDVTPNPEAITIRERHSLVALPEPGFRMRASDPRSAFFGISYQDYSQPLSGQFVQRFAARHRLEKKNPGAARSEAVKPIVYYVDNTAPEPIRSALVEGTRWWNQAFEAAGYIDAFRVEVLPDSIDPLDVHYNVIEYAHRATRGWSYGGAVTDPRTGEMMKGHVILGSLRARQDYLIGEGLDAPYANGTENADRVQEMVLARIRQLAAHEVGHTLGMAHNYISSAQKNTSVMDYPHPMITLSANGDVDITKAYETGIGEWDKVAVTWGYGTFAGDERKALDSVLVAARARGLTFLTDQDARPVGSASPDTHLWDNGPDAVAELKRMMTVRSRALTRFGETVIKRGAPLATMEDVLVPVYLHHRYQLEAAIKVVGGVSYAYNMRGDGLPGPVAVPAARQLSAIDAITEVLAPANLALPRALLAQLPPRPFLIEPTRELFDRWTGLTFDPLAPGATIATVTFDLLLDEERASRMVAQQAIDPALPGFDDLLTRLESRIFGRANGSGYDAALNALVQRAYVDHLLTLADGATMPLVRAEARQSLVKLLDTSLRARAGTASSATHAQLAADIRGWIAGTYKPAEKKLKITVPPGSPIGDR
ncbi:MAG TPA: zinc-dependent metalloprotease [Gemmatimonadaceae bacterium]|nr:zinc-dependent metalloprotease [Gemmatimonadaceae bacterium]